MGGEASRGRCGPLWAGFGLAGDSQSEIVPGPDIRFPVLGYNQGHPGVYLSPAQGPASTLF
jgi:hypothetical protein